MNRRTFIGMVAVGAIAAAFAARSQQTERVRRIGVLSVEAFPPEQWQSIQTALRETGWIEGRNLIVESRDAHGDIARLRPLADELVRLKVELIVGAGTVASLAAKDATSTVPIVFFGSGDPLRTGLVTNLARPGGNITGTTTIATDLGAKRAQLLRETLPSAVRIGELVNLTNPVFRLNRDELERTYRSLGVQPIFVEVGTADELEGAVGKVAERGGQALIVSADPLFAAGPNWERVKRAAQRHRIPMLVENRGALEAGGLISFNVSWDEINRKGASFIDRILKGANPGDLPVEQPTKFELLINLKTAKAYGITVPQSLLLRADEVIR